MSLHLDLIVYTYIFIFILRAKGARFMCLFVCLFAFVNCWNRFRIVCIVPKRVDLVQGVGYLRGGQINRYSSSFDPECPLAAPTWNYFTSINTRALAMAKSLKDLIGFCSQVLFNCETQTEPALIANEINEMFQMPAHNFYKLFSLVKIFTNCLSKYLRIAHGPTLEMFVESFRIDPMRI